MDFRKTEAQGQFQALKQECKFTIELLENLLHMCYTHVNALNDMDNKTFRQYSKYYLAVLNFQTTSKQKIMEWNIDFEEFLLEKRPPDISHFKNSNSNPNASVYAPSNSSSPSFTSCSPISPTISFAPETILSTHLPTLKICDKREEEVSFGKDEKSSTNNVEEKSSTNRDISVSVKEANEYENLIDTGECEYENLIDIDDDFNSTSPFTEINNSPSVESTNTIVSDSQQPSVEILEQSFSSSDNYFSLSSYNQRDVNETQETHMKKKENINNDGAKSLGITEQLKALPVMSLQEKFQRTLRMDDDIPNLNLKLAEDTTNKAPEKNTSINGGINGDLSNNDESLQSTSLVQKRGDLWKMERHTNMEHNREIHNHTTTLKIGDFCMFGYAVSPSEFYVQVVDENSSFIDLLSVQLSDIYENTSYTYHSKTNAMSKLGNICSCKIENCWYRVEVLDWILDGTVGANPNLVVLQLIDYGYKYQVEYGGLRPLLPELQKLPKMAHKCHLGDVYPPGSTKSNLLKSWSNSSIEFFFEIIGNMDINVFQLTQMDFCKEKNSYAVDLVKINNDYEEQTIGEILIEYKYAVKVSKSNGDVLKNHTMINQVQTALGLKGLVPNMSTEEILETFCNQMEYSEASNINEAVMHYDPRDEAETCKNLRRDGTCYKGSACKFRHIPLTNGFTRDRVPIYDKAFMEDALPTVGQEVSLTISHIVDIQSFYAQIRKENQIYGFPSLQNLIETMNNPDTVKNYEKLEDWPVLSQMVIAKHWNDFWYRAQVRSVQYSENLTTSTAEVYIVDFGDTLEVSIDDLRKILPDFLEMSFQAVSCKLYNVKHKEDVDPMAEKTHFENHLGETYTAKIMSASGYLDVILTNDSQEDIGLQLIEDGYGELNAFHCFPAESEMILID